MLRQFDKQKKIDTLFCNAREENLTFKHMRVVYHNLHNLKFIIPGISIKYLLLYSKIEN